MYKRQVLDFVLQLLVLFLLLAFLESCGSMARIAFVLDRIFRRFGLSGKSFIPMLVATGCGVPGIMASRTIENDRDRKMTIITTTFMPCGAKLPIIALISGALFGGAWWVAPSAYFIGIGAIILSGIILKKTRRFAGDPAPFVMELPAYHWPTVPNVLRSMWERGWSFIKKAGTIILLSAIVLWFLQGFGFENGSFGMVEDLNNSILAAIGSAVAWILSLIHIYTALLLEEESMAAVAASVHRTSAAAAAAGGFALFLVPHPMDDDGRPHGRKNAGHQEGGTVCSDPVEHEIIFFWVMLRCAVWLPACSQGCWVRDRAGTTGIGSAPRWPRPPQIPGGCRRR